MSACPCPVQWDKHCPKVGDFELWDTSWLRECFLGLHRGYLKQADDLQMVWFLPALIPSTLFSELLLYEMGWTLNEWVDSGGTKAWNCYVALLGNVMAIGFAADYYWCDYLGNAGLARLCSPPGSRYSSSITWNLAISHKTPPPPAVNPAIPYCAVCNARQLLTLLSVTSSNFSCHIQEFSMSFPVTLISGKGFVSSQPRQYRNTKIQVWWSLLLPQVTKPDSCLL